MFDTDSKTRRLNIVGDVVNLIPIYWIADEIVSPSLPYQLQVTDDSLKVDLSIKGMTNLVGGVDAKDVYRAFSEVTEYV